MGLQEHLNRGHKHLKNHGLPQRKKKEKSASVSLHYTCWDAQRFKGKREDSKCPLKASVNTLL